MTRYSEERKAAVNWARRELDWDIPNPNPAEGRKRQEAPGRTRWLSRSAVALLDVAAAMKRGPHLVNLIRLGLFTGMRPG